MFFCIIYSRYQIKFFKVFKKKSIANVFSKKKKTKTM